MADGYLYEPRAEGVGEASCKGIVADPDAVDAGKAEQALGQYLGDEHCDFRLDFPLVFLELVNPTITPGLCAFRFPYQSTAGLPRLVAEPCGSRPPRGCPFGTSSMQSRGKDTPERLFQGQFRHLSLELLRPCIRLSL